MLKLAIMGAMREEIEPILKHFSDIKVNEYANNKYYEFKYDNLEIILAYSKIGKVNASLTASVLIEKFKCNVLLFTGVAGAINPDLKIGDLLIANKLCQHDIDITAFGHPYGYIPEGKVFIETSKILRDLAFHIASENNIKLSLASIATGDQFINSNTQKDFIKNTFRADALEMEGASVALVCDALDVPFLVLRSISDTANMDAGFDFDEFLKSSSKTSANFILHMIDKLKNFTSIEDK